MALVLAGAIIVVILIGFAIRKGISGGDGQDKEAVQSVEESTEPTSSEEETTIDEESLSPGRGRKLRTTKTS